MGNRGRWRESGHRDAERSACTRHRRDTETAARETKPNRSSPRRANDLRCFFFVIKYFPRSLLSLALSVTRFSSPLGHRLFLYFSRDGKKQKQKKKKKNTTTLLPTEMYENTVYVGHRDRGRGRYLEIVYYNWYAHARVGISPIRQQIVYYAIFLIFFFLFYPHMFFNGFFFSLLVSRVNSFCVRPLYAQIRQYYRCVLTLP